MKNNITSFILTCPYCKKDCMIDKSEFEDTLICPYCGKRCKVRPDKNTKFDFWHLVKKRN